MTYKFGDASIQYAELASDTGSITSNVFVDAGVSVSVSLDARAKLAIDVNFTGTVLTVAGYVAIQIGNTDYASTLVLPALGQANIDYLSDELAAGSYDVKVRVKAGSLGSVACSPVGVPGQRCSLRVERIPT